MTTSFLTLSKLMKVFFIFFVMTALLPSFVYAAPENINFQANIRKPDGTALDSSSVQFTFKYKDTTGTCTVFVETFNNVSMVGSGGYISFKLGSGNPVHPGGPVKLFDVFSNSATNSMACFEGGNYTPLLMSEIRKLTIEFSYAGSNGIQAINNIEINSIPYSMYATQAETAVQATSFTGNLLGDITGTQSATVVSNLRGTPLSATAPTAGQVLQFVSGQWIPQTIAAGGATGPAGGDLSGTYPNPSVVASSSATINSIVRRDASGNASFNTVQANNFSGRNLILYEPTDTNKVTVQAPTTFAAGDYTLTLPDTNGSAGQVLSTDGNGVTSWISPTSGTVTNVSSANGDIAVATGTTTPVLTLNSGTAANQILKLDGTGKIPAVDGSLITNLDAGQIVTGVLPIARGGTNATTANGALNNLLPTQATHAGKVLQTDGTNTSWVTASSGTVTNVTGTLPISVATGTTTPVISVATATGAALGVVQTGANITNTAGVISVTGANVNAALGYTAADSAALSNYLPLAGGTMSGHLDMGTNKILNVSNIPFTAANPTGTEDGKTLRWNNTMGVWEWFTAGAAGSGITSINGLSTGVQSFAIGTAGTAPAFTSATATHTLDIPMASTAAVTAGLISKTDYDTFNNKLGTATVFVGDVSGTSSTTSVDKIKGTAVTITSITSGDFLKYNGTDWVNTPLVAGDIPNLDASKITTGVLPIARGGTGSGVANTALNNLLPTQATHAGKVLQTDGTNTSWVAASSGTVTNIATGTGLTGGPITATGTISLADTAVTPGTYGSSTAVPNFTVDAQGRLTLAGSNAYATATGATMGIVQTGANITNTAGVISVTGANVNAALGYTAADQAALGNYVLKTGDTMTGALNLPLNGLAVGTNQFVVSGGHVGVGTGSPGYKLDVDGSVQIQNTTSNSLYVGSVTSGNYFRMYTPGAGGQSPEIDFVASGARKTVIGYDHGVGRSIFYNDTLGAGIYLDNGSGIAVGTNPGSYSGNAFYIEQQNNKVYTSSTMNVGIGTSTPDNKLTVNGNACVSGMCIGRSGSHYSEIGHNIGFSGTNDVYTYRNSDTAAALRMGSNGDFEFRTAGVGTAGAPLSLDQRMIIKLNGNVGIGTSTPAHKLDVVGDVNITGQYLVNGVPIGGGSGTVTNVSSANTDISVATGTTTPVLTLNSGTAANQILKLDGTGKIPAVDGSLITNLDATNITAGILPIARGGTGSGVANTALNNLLPTQATHAGKVLQTDGTNTSWVAASSGTVTNVTASAPLASTGGVTPNITMQQADSTHDGYLAQADFIAFNSKVSSQWTDNGANIYFNTGNVGIGTSSPGVKLHVEGSSGVAQGHIAGFVNTTNGAYTTLTSAGSSSVVPTWNDGAQILEFVPFGSGNGILSSYTGDLKFQTNARMDSMVIKNTGNVGIGTSNPGEKLYVMNEPGAQNSFGGNGSSVFASDSGVGLIVSSKTGDIFRGYQNATQVFVINNSGRVGLGVTNPTQKLDVVGNVNITGQYLVNGVPIGGGSGTVTNIATGTGLTGGPITATGTISLADTAVTPGTYGSTTAVPSFTVDAQGRLTLAGSNAYATATGATMGIVQTGANITNTAGVISVTGANVNAALGYTAANNAALSNYLPLAGGTMSGALNMNSSAINQVSYMDITNMDISGVIGVGLGGSPSESIETAGNIKAVSFISTSDRRLKQNIRSIAGLSSITKLNGYQYEWKKNNESDAGVIAQEVEKIFPAAVRTDARTGYKGVKYQYLIAPMINSIKELNNKCTQNENEIDTVQRELASVKEEAASLKQENQDLKRRLELIEKKLGIK